MKSCMKKIQEGSAEVTFNQQSSSLLPSTMAPTPPQDSADSSGIIADQQSSSMPPVRPGGLDETNDDVLPHLSDFGRRFFAAYDARCCSEDSVDNNTLNIVQQSSSSMEPNSTTHVPEVLPEDNDDDDDDFAKQYLQAARHWRRAVEESERK